MRFHHKPLTSRDRRCSLHHTGLIVSFSVRGAHGFLPSVFLGVGLVLLAHFNSILAAEPGPLGAPIPSSSPAASPVLSPNTTAAAASLVASTSLPSPFVPDLDDKHRLAIGDRLSFRIQEDLDDPLEPREPKPLIVSDLGDLEVPYIGRVLAEGKTCRQLAREIKSALEIDYYHHATVMLSVDLMAKSRGKVYLVGPIRMPGPQEIPSDEVLTVSKAITRAGGFTDFADRRNVKITRAATPGGAEKRSIVVDVGEILEKGKVEHDLPLEPGDLIIVPERAVRF